MKSSTRIHVKALFVGALIIVVGGIVVSRLYWYVLAEFMKSGLGGDGFYQNHTLMVRVFFLIGAFGVPLLLSVVGGYVAALLATIHQARVSIAVGFAGTILCLLYILIAGEKVEYFYIYVILALLYPPAALTGGLLAKIREKSRADFIN